MKRVEAILYAATAEEGRQILMDTQQEFAGRVFLEEDEAAAQVGGMRRHSGGSVGGVDYCGNAEVRVTVPVTCMSIRLASYDLYRAPSLTQAEAAAAAQ